MKIEFVARETQDFASLQAGAVVIVREKGWRVVADGDLGWLGMHHDVEGLYPPYSVVEILRSAFHAEHLCQQTRPRVGDRLRRHACQHRYLRGDEP